MSSEHVTIELQPQRGWIYVDKHGPRKWGWEARMGGYGIDAGIEKTKREALACARQAVSDYLAGTER